MNIQTAAEVPPQAKYQQMYDAASALELGGRPLEIPFATDEECRLAYWAFRQWAMREGVGLRAAKRGDVLFIERVA